MLDFVELAEKAWDEASEIHRHAKHSHWIASFQDKSSYPIDNYLRSQFEALNFAGKSIAQMSCNNGRELISLKLLGAGRCVGFDLSGGALSEARDLTEAASTDCEFVKADCQNLPEQFASEFDFVLITAGALCFIPDIAQYFRQAASLLAEGGKVLVYESHPILNMFDMDRDRTSTAEIKYPYFVSEPKRHIDGIDYYTHKQYAAKEIYYFQYTLADILTATRGAGLALQQFEELPFDPSKAFGAKAFSVNAPMGIFLQMEA
jgi:SAM-dependent methyltransferase